MTKEQLEAFARVASTPWIEEHILGADELPFDALADLADACRTIAEREAPTAAYEVAAALSDLVTAVPWSRLDAKARMRHVSRHWFVHRSPEWAELQRGASAVMAAAGTPLHVWESARG